MSSRAVRPERIRRDRGLAALHRVAFRPPARQAAGEDRDALVPEYAEASTTPASRCRGPPCRRPRRASRCRRPAPRRCARRAPATAACGAATSRDRRCCRCRRRPRPGCGPPGTRQPDHAPTSADATSRPAPAPRCRRRLLRRARPGSRPGASHHRSRRVSEGERDAPVVPALALDLADDDRPDLSCPRDVGAAAGLQVDPVHIDHPDPAVA